MRDKNHSTEVEMGENCAWNIISRREWLGRTHSELEQPVLEKEKIHSISEMRVAQDRLGPPGSTLYFTGEKRGPYRETTCLLSSQPLEAKVRQLIISHPTHTPTHTHTHIPHTPLHIPPTHTPLWVPTAPCTSGHWDGPGIRSRPDLSEERVLEKPKHHLRVHVRVSRIISGAGANGSMSS